MPKFYNYAECRRKAEQHWEMAGLARQYNDRADAAAHTYLAKEWDQRAQAGGGTAPAPAQNKGRTA